MEKSEFTILVVDDEIGICEVIKNNFEMEGYHVITCHSGCEAVEVFSKNKVDFVISDVRMNNGDGIFFTDEVRKIDPKKPPILLMSGFAEITREEAMKHGALDLLCKPVDFSVMEEWVDKNWARLK